MVCGNIIYFSSPTTFKYCAVTRFYTGAWTSARALHKRQAEVLEEIFRNRGTNDRNEVLTWGGYLPLDS
ncbi:hypothetical protein NDU88_000790 [Pleurodeles waltl]|uniref:Uncharacterized protein n=1 Tax=Pleurodeles waltl TaxID=8319 RepID=A0AAV7UST8_PLEWA|nr:hypothetical protein NDU88_000790 [Pleurodeles waltl]